MDTIQEAFQIAAYAVTSVAAVTVAIVALRTLRRQFVTVQQQTAAIIETFGKYSRTLGPGLQWVPYPISRVATIEDLRLRKLDFVAKVNTSDNAFCELPVSLHYRVTDPRKAFYELKDYEGQMQNFAVNEVRSKGASMGMTDLFRSTDGIKTAIMSALETKIEQYGFKIEDVVVKTAMPSDKVREAFDTVIASTRLREAAENEGEAAKIKTVKAAEAEAEAMKLYGQGIADQRIAIARGSEEAMIEMAKSGLSLEQSAVVMLITNGQEAAVKASGNEGTVILTTTSPNSVASDGASMLAMFRSLGRNQPAPQ